jgi:hypothetical protein
MHNILPASLKRIQGADLDGNRAGAGSIPPWIDQEADMGEHSAGGSWALALRDSYSSRVSAL